MILLDGELSAATILIRAIKPIIVWIAIIELHYSLGIFLLLSHSPQLLVSSFILKLKQNLV